MANREELLIIRAARAGQAAAQLTLGKRYLFGSPGLPKSSATALYWLDRAARQHEQDAWILIGSHIPFETVRQATQPDKLCFWYERAFDAGVVQAGLVFAKLVLAQGKEAVDESLCRKALLALKTAAHAGIPDAQWLLAQHIERMQAGAPHRSSDNQDDNGEASTGTKEAALEWTMRAAAGGMVQAQRALADRAWDAADYPMFLHWALPLAREIARYASALNKTALQLRNDDALLLSRSAQALSRTADPDQEEMERYWELAAQAGDRNAQFSLGLWLARMDANGARTVAIPGLAHYKKSLRWLALSAEQGLADAWYAMSKIYLKPEFSQRSVADAQRYLERAAESGHSAAQAELGMSAWRTRREQSSNDTRAVYWLQKAAAQGNREARILLEKIAGHASPAAWAQAAKRRLTRDMVNVFPFLAARIELAALFGLSRTEALLLDLNAADCGHCLLVDIRAQHPRSGRRLILVQTGHERQTLSRIARLFEDVDCGPDGPEGNYRQRLYRLKSLVHD
ncbi:MAG: SEL1-like repeat protein [Herminiimonas sp.]|nr:SEL1-like repeat protein [Herminiimonas sp.]